eukprot:1456505-Pleurochrysis_carterae.AAC.1
MLCVLLRALEVHKVDPPPPGPKQKDQAVSLLLAVTKKKRLPVDDSDEQSGTIDLADASSDISLASAGNRRQQQGRRASRRGKGKGACVTADAEGGDGVIDEEQ